jgi:hypothetical protein
LYLEMMRAQVHPLRPHDSGKVFHRREFIRGRLQCFEFLQS